jgi:hypothetical protein
MGGGGVRCGSSGAPDLMASLLIPIVHDLKQSKKGRPRAGLQTRHKLKGFRFVPLLK